MSLYKKRDAAFPLYEISLSGATDHELQDVSANMGIGLSLDEIKSARNYFKSMGRNPTDIELQALGQAWSEHCCYKSSKPILKEFVFGIDAPQNILAISEDAGVVEFDEEHAYVIALESHNHPSAVEPYGGAATGIGGIIRDVVCMGAQPIALVDPLFFGRLDTPQEDVPKGIKHPGYLFSGVVSGIRDYGNRIGIPTMAGMVYFDDDYLGNCLVNVGCIGIMEKKHLIHSSVKKPGDIYVLVGGRTGRDGIHGVTFASAELTESSEESSRGAVQIGDPITKEPLMHACLEVNERGLLNGMKDLGGGGLSCVVGEMALAGGYGAEVYLDHVPLKEGELAPWEIWVSESQERFMLAVDESNLDEVLYIFRRWDIDATVIGKCIPEKILRIFYEDEMIFEIELEFLTNGPVYRRECEIAETLSPAESIDGMLSEPDDYNEILLSLLSSQNICSREWVIRQYDHEVRASTIIKPLQGKLGYSSHGDATVVKPLRNSYRGLAITCDVNPSYMRIDPFWGAASALDEICRNLVSVGGRPHSLADCLNFGNPEKADRLGVLHEACRGLGFVAKKLGIPFISGNVSLYNETALGSIPGTPVVLGIGIVNDVRECVTTDLKKAGSSLYLVGCTSCELGGSEYLRLLNRLDSGAVPRVDPDALDRSMKALLSAINDSVLLECHDVSEGGTGVCLAEMSLGGDMGVMVDIGSIAGSLRSDVKLFSESNTRWIIEVDTEREGDLKSLLSASKVDFCKLGVTSNDGRIRVSDGSRMLVDVSLKDARYAWERTIYNLIG